MWERSANFTTVHQAKGLEADTVILVAPDRDFPLVHPA